MGWPLALTTKSLLLQEKDNLIRRGCDWLQGDLQHHPADEADRIQCDRVR
ncbi:MAG: hypothetical protein WBA10_10595 [Elainellaceae cyanobacterium]